MKVEDIQLSIIFVSSVSKDIYVLGKRPQPKILLSIF